MNLTTSRRAETIEAISTWFYNSIESLDQFGEYEQLQLIICAKELNYDHSNISQKVDEIAIKPESSSTDYVYTFLEQMVLMKYQAGEERRKHYFDYWVQKENQQTQSDLTKAYVFGYLLMEENVLSTSELKRKAIAWLSDTVTLPSMPLTAWTVNYLENHKELDASRRRFDELIDFQLENGSWNNIPLLTLQIAYPLSLTSFGSSESLKATSKFILNQPWEAYSGDIRYETGLIKWLSANKYI